MYKLVAEVTVVVVVGEEKDEVQQVLGVAQECCWRFDQMDYSATLPTTPREAQSWVESSLIPDKMGRRAGNGAVEKSRGNTL